jgi:hypothetical protein
MVLPWHGRPLRSTNDARNFEELIDANQGSNLPGKILDTIDPQIRDASEKLSPYPSASALRLPQKTEFGQFA